MFIVGEAWGAEEELHEKPFIGPPGYLLRNALAHNGVNMDYCYLTNVFNFRPYNNDIEKLCGVKEYAIPGYRAYKRGKFVIKKYEPEIERLWQEIKKQQPNCILALGATAMLSLIHI